VPSCPMRLIMHWVEEGMRAGLFIFTGLMSFKLVYLLRGTVGDVCLAASLLRVCPSGTASLGLMAEMFKQGYLLQNCL